MFYSLHNRLSYHQRIVDIVPESFSALVPAKPTTVYKFGGETGSGKSEGYPNDKSRFGSLNRDREKKPIMLLLNACLLFVFKMK